MSLIHLFFPQTILLPDTKFNKNIIVKRYLSQPTLMVDGLVESGDILTHIWKTALNRLVPKNFTPKKVLLLGLGGGSNALLVAHRYPQSHITAVEIDPQMVDICYNYFNAKKINNLHIVIDDALHFISQLTQHDLFDITMVDCFVGKYIPKQLEQLDFIDQIYKHSRFTLINRIHWFEHRAPTLNFIRSLRNKFIFITTKTRSNTIISLV